MSTQSATIVQRLWNYCNVLRDDGVSYGDYVEQLTYLLFLKMADEQVRELGKAPLVPGELGWPSLLGRDGEALEVHYRHILAELGKGLAHGGIATERLEEGVPKRGFPRLGSPRPCGFE